MKGQPVVLSDQGQPVVIMGYMKDGQYIEGLPDNGGGSGSAPIVKNQADLVNIENPEDGQLVAVLETNTFWQYNASTSTWTNTDVSYLSHYGGQVAETNLNITFQDAKTDIELIELFGVVSDSEITVDQSNVKYDVFGKHSVIFKFGKGRPITCSINIISRYTYDKETLHYNCKLLPNSTNFGDLYPLDFDFSDFRLVTNGATVPIINGNKHEWRKRPSSDINKIEIYFDNLTMLSDGSMLSGRITFGEFDIHAKVDTDQKWGFDIIDGKFVYLSSGFVFQKIYLELFKENGDIVYLNLASRIDNVNYAKHAGSDVGISEFFVSADTLLLGETYDPANAELPIFVASRYEGDTDTPGSDNIALGIVRQDTTSMSFVFGKDYTGKISEDASTFNYLDFPIFIRAQELVSIKPTHTVYRENITPTQISSGGNIVLAAVQPGILKPELKYEIVASAKYRRTSGNSNPSIVEIQMLQGARTIVKDYITVTRDTSTYPITLNIPDIVKRYQFNSNETVVIEALVPAGQPNITIEEIRVRFIEVNEMEE